MTDALADGFDTTIHAPNRLRICALLDAAGEAEFSAVQDQLGVSASVVSKHITTLMDAGYVEQHKAVRDTRQRVWLHLTRRAGPSTAPMWQPSERSRRAGTAAVTARREVITGVCASTPGDAVECGEHKGLWRSW